MTSTGTSTTERKLKQKFKTSAEEKKIGWIFLMNPKETMKTSPMLLKKEKEGQINS
jgi:hypothetical protein